MGRQHPRATPCAPARVESCARNCQLRPLLSRRRPHERGSPCPSTRLRGGGDSQPPRSRRGLSPHASISRRDLVPIPDAALRGARCGGSRAVVLRRLRQSWSVPRSRLRLRLLARCRQRHRRAPRACRSSGGGTRQAGFVAEERPSAPHLTLSQSHPSANVRELAERMPALQAQMASDADVLFRTRFEREFGLCEVAESFSASSCP